jgi:hypothetical protein
MTRGAYTLTDYPAGSLIEIDCPKCRRHGRYRRETLLEWFGPNVTLPDVLVGLSSDCLRRGAGRYSDPCDAVYRTLPPPSR